MSKYQPSPKATLFERLATFSVTQPNGCVLWVGGADKDGYGRMRWGGKRHRLPRLILELKLGRPLKRGAQACHTCDTPACILADHLWEGTHMENVEDRSLKRRERFGEANPACRLSDQQVRSVRSLYSTGKFSQQQIADDFGVSQTLVSAITRGVIRQIEAKR